MKLISIVKQDRWLLIICLALSIVYLVPFALGGAYSVDDWLRSDTGNSGWEGNGRPAASIIMAVMSLLPNGLSFFGDNVLQDTYPFSMFLGGMVMVSAGYLLKNVLEVKSQFLAGVIILFPLTNPYWIGNLEFRHDSLIMSVAFFLAVFSAVVLKRTNCKRLALSVIISVACLTIMLMIYQAALNVYMSVTVVIVAVLCIKKEQFNDILLHIIKSILSMLIAYAIYSAVINNFVTLSEYTKSFHIYFFRFKQWTIWFLRFNSHSFIGHFFYFKMESTRDCSFFDANSIHSIDSVPLCWCAYPSGVPCYSRASDDGLQCFHVFCRCNVLQREDWNSSGNICNFT